MYANRPFFNSVSAGETEKMIHEWDGLTRFLDSVMSRFFKVDNCQVSRHGSPSYMTLLTTIVIIH